MAAQSSLNPGDSIGFRRLFHVELFRGGMNRLLLRAMPTAENPDRVEVLFQYVQRVNMPMEFAGLRIEDSTDADRTTAPWDDVLVEFPELRVWSLVSNSRVVGRVA